MEEGVGSAPRPARWRSSMSTRPADPSRRRRQSLRPQLWRLAVVAQSANDRRRDRGARRRADAGAHRRARAAGVAGRRGDLRTTGRAREAVPVILEALRLGVRYCDTAPAYQQSQDYYGEAFRAAGAARARWRLSRVEDARAHARPRAAPARRFAAAARHRPARPLADARPARSCDELDVALRQGRRARGGARGPGRRARALHRAHRPPRSAHPARGDARASRSTASSSRSTRPTRAIARSSRRSSPRRGARASASSA